MSPARSRQARRSPLAFFLVLALAIVVASILLLNIQWSVRPVWGYLLGVNLATFLAYGFDKTASVRQWTRVPELLLHLLALLGGTPAAWVGQKTFRHKTLKQSFRTRFYWIIAIQIALIGGWIWTTWR